MTTLARMYFVWSIPIDPCFLFVGIGVVIVLAIMALGRFRRPRD